MNAKDYAEKILLAKQEIENAEELLRQVCKAYGLPNAEGRLGVAKHRALTSAMTYVEAIEREIKLAEDYGSMNHE